MSASTRYVPELALRRADWRFLLPEPELGRVAYPAPRDATLVEALREVSDGVDGAPLTQLAGYDVVVITGGGRHAVEDAAATAPAGAWLVVELGGPAALSAAGRLRRQGLEHVAAHWLWPDAERCREIVPLRPTALRMALDRRDPGARLRLRVRVARALARTPLFALAVKRAVVIARVPS
jgi:hypothetical protein